MQRTSGFLPPLIDEFPGFYEIQSVATDWRCAPNEILNHATEGRLQLSQRHIEARLAQRRGVNPLSSGPTGLVVDYLTQPVDWDGSAPISADKRKLGILKSERDRFEADGAKLSARQWKVWRQRSLWPIDCAVLLLHRINPDSVRALVYKVAFGVLEGQLSNYQLDVLKRFGGDIMTDWHTSDSWRRAGDFAVLNGGVSPKEFIKLAIDKDVTVPEELQALVQKEEIEAPLNKSERESLLKMVLGMAVAKYGFDPRRSENDATGKNKESIWDDLDSLGIAVDSKTVRKHLKEAVRRFPKLKLT